MIWTWLVTALTFLAKLIIPAPPAPPDQKIDPMQKCPSCGHRDGVIRAIDNNGQPLVQHQCKVCLAKWQELPVLRTQKPAMIHAQPAAKQEITLTKTA